MVLAGRVGRLNTSKRETHSFLCRHVAGLLLLNFRLLFNAAQDKLHMKEIVEKDFFSPLELDHLYSLHKGYPTAMSIGMQILQVLEEASEHGILGATDLQSQFMLNQLTDSVKRLRSSCGGVGLYTSVQLPFPFVQIITGVVYAFSIQLIVVCASFIGSGLAGEEGNITTGYLTLSLYTFVLFGLLKLFTVLQNPLGDDPADFPGDSYYESLKSDLLSVTSHFKPISTLPVRVPVDSAGPGPVGSNSIRSSSGSKLPMELFNVSTTAREGNIGCFKTMYSPRSSTIVPERDHNSHNMYVQSYGDETF